MYTWHFFLQFWLILFKRTTNPTTHISGGSDKVLYALYSGEANSTVLEKKSGKCRRFSKKTRISHRECRFYIRYIFSYIFLFNRGVYVLRHLNYAK